MARIRTVKPEFWAHEDLSQLPEATHMLAAALLNHADDEGFFNAHPGLVRAACSPLREPSVSILESLILLAGIGFITLSMGTDGKLYGHIVKFEEHQRVNRPTPSKIKGLISLTECSVSNNGAITERSPPERKGTGNREQGRGTGKETGAAAPDPERLDLHDAFATLWSGWPTGYGEKGSRKNAEAAFLKLKPDRALFAVMLRALDAQAQHKAEAASAGQFAAPFQHIERWIKNRRWEDEISQFAARPAARQSASDAAFERFLAGAAESEAAGGPDSLGYLEGHAFAEPH